jgi:hypothetical protein
MSASTGPLAGVKVLELGVMYTESISSHFEKIKNFTNKNNDL